MVVPIFININRFVSRINMKEIHADPAHHSVHWASSEVAVARTDQEEKAGVEVSTQFSYLYNNNNLSCN